MTMRIGVPKDEGWEMTASGYAAVWAKENTRESIFDAMARKEVYATTGTRLMVRFFGGWDYTPDDLNSRQPAFRGYEKGVPIFVPAFSDCSAGFGIVKHQVERRKAGKPETGTLPVTSVPASENPAVGRGRRRTAESAACDSCRASTAGCI